MITEADLLTTKDDKYAPYYLRAEGDFFYFYFTVAMFLLFSLIFATCIAGSCLFMGGSTMALKQIEEVLKNVDNLPEMMKNKANKDDGYNR